MREITRQEKHRKPEINRKSENIRHLWMDRKRENKRQMDGQNERNTLHRWMDRKKENKRQRWMCDGNEKQRTQEINVTEGFQRRLSLGSYVPEGSFSLCRIGEAEGKCVAKSS